MYYLEVCSLVQSSEKIKEYTSPKNSEMSFSLDAVIIFDKDPFRGCREIHPVWIQSCRTISAGQQRRLCPPSPFPSLKVQLTHSLRGNRVHRILTAGEATPGMVKAARRLLPQCSVDHLDVVSCVVIPVVYLDGPPNRKRTLGYASWVNGTCSKSGRRQEQRRL